MTDDAAVEAAARAAHRASYEAGRHLYPGWHTTDRWEKERWLEIARAALAAAEPEMWQPIETAPKEPKDRYGYGPNILLFDARGDGEDETRTRAIGAWGIWEHGPTCWCMEAGDGWTAPTHWRPLPAPPGAKP